MLFLSRLLFDIVVICALVTLWVQCTAMQVQLCTDSAAVAIYFFTFMETIADVLCALRSVRETKWAASRTTDQQLDLDIFGCFLLNASASFQGCSLVCILHYKYAATTVDYVTISCSILATLCRLMVKQNNFFVASVLIVCYGMYIVSTFQIAFRIFNV